MASILTQASSGTPHWRGGGSQEVEATGIALITEHLPYKRDLLGVPIPTRAPPFPPPRIPPNVCYGPPVSEPPGSCPACRPKGSPPSLSQNPPGQAQGPLFVPSSPGRLLQTEILSSLSPPRPEPCVCGERGWWRQGLGQSRTPSDKMAKLRHGLGPMKRGAGLTFGNVFRLC